MAAPPSRSIDPDAERRDDRAMDDRLRRLESDVASINARLDTVLPTLATKFDVAELAAELKSLESRLEAKLFKALNDQTWKFMGVATGLVAAVYFIARNVH
jgi:hypothetical protein